jgi:hypothetical protein
MPTASDLVTDLPADFETFGQAVATSMADLLGGTTGQVLSKASNTNMDFTWVTTDDANAIQNTIVDAKGDLIAASANDTPARLAVGNNGETLVADSSTSTGLRYTALFGANKNKIINGDFFVNQRNFTSETANLAYGFDRWRIQAVDGTVTYTPQTFTPGAAPVAGYEGKTFARIVTTGQTLTSARATLQQSIESVRTLAGQTATISFWAKAASGTPKIAIDMRQGYGSGGSPSTDSSVYAGQVTISTSWVRYSVTVAIPSLSGKTIGTNNDDSLIAILWVSAGSDSNARTGSLGIQSNTFDIWGVQVEAGSVATAFQTATGTIQGELAACSRYYFRNSAATSVFTFFTNGFNFSTTQVMGVYTFPVTMRIGPTLETSGTASNYRTFSTAGSINCSAVPLQDTTNPNTMSIQFAVASGLTAGQGASVLANNSSAAFLGFNAEL